MSPSNYLENYNFTRIKNKSNINFQPFPPSLTGVNTATVVQKQLLKRIQNSALSKILFFCQKLQQVSPCFVRANQPLIFSSKESDLFSSLNMSHSTFYATVSNCQDVKSQCNFMAGVGNLSAPKGNFSLVTDG